MKRFTLARLTDTGLATFGHWLDDVDNLLYVTLEPPWRNNAHGISCIPAGTYIAKRRFSAKHHGEVFGLLDVPNRSDIEIHVGNTVADTEGCILLGMDFDEIGDAHGIAESRKAVARFMASLLGVDTFALRVVDPIAPAA